MFQRCLKLNMSKIASIAFCSKLIILLYILSQWIYHISFNLLLCHAQPHWPACYCVNKPRQVLSEELCICFFLLPGMSCLSNFQRLYLLFTLHLYLSFIYFILTVPLQRSSSLSILSKGVAHPLLVFSTFCYLSFLCL